MKNLIILLMVMTTSPVSAKPYFRPIDLKHPVIAAGTFMDPSGGAKPDVGSQVCLISHSTRDGSIFKSIQADWCLLGVGGGYGNGAAFASAGPSANTLPVVKSVTLAILDAWVPDRFPNLRQLLSPVADGSGPDISANIGPQFVTHPIEGGVILPFNKWKGYLRIFAGAAWRF